MSLVQEILIIFIGFPNTQGPHTTNSVVRNILTRYCIMVPRAWRIWL